MSASTDFSYILVLYTSCYDLTKMAKLIFIILFLFFSFSIILVLILFFSFSHIGMHEILARVRVSICVSVAQQSNRNSIEFFLSTQTWSVMTWQNS